MNIILLVLVCVIIFAILIYIYRLITYKRIISGGAHLLKDLQKYPRTKSEAGVIKILEEITNEKFPTVNPDWLLWHGSKLELDGYSEKLKIALEFSGPLHTKWYPGKETYAKYFDRVMKDRIKKQLCEKNKVKLIVVDMSLPRVHWRNYLLSRLYDIGYIKDKPIMYILEQTTKPFRNKQLEKELGLNPCKL